MHRILSVGLDSSLLRQRNRLLQSAGHSVVASFSLKEAVNRIQISDLDLILLCRSIPASDREGLTCLIRASGSLVPVISIANKSGQRDMFPDATFNEHDPSNLLLSIQEMLESSTKKRSAPGPGRQRHSDPLPREDSSSFHSREIKCHSM
jgi:CheY-like chemotaxis protein